MITVDGIRKKADNKYKVFLQSIINDTSVFPWVVPSDKATDKDYGTKLEQTQPIVDSSKKVKGYGYTYQFDKTGSKIIKIEFESADDYIKFLGKEEEVAYFQLTYHSITSEFSTLKELFCNLPEIVIDNRNKWDNLLKVCRYLQKKSHAGLYMRELPVSVHTKFIEKNKEIILQLIERIEPDLINAAHDNFEDKLGLKKKHNLIRIRFLDDSLQPLPGYQELGIAETEINKLNINCKRVFVIENDIPSLTFPKVKDSIILFGKGYNIAALKNIEWLKNSEIYYWSDFDLQGYEMLSQMRKYYSHTESFLMDFETLMASRTSDEGWADGSKSKIKELDNLHPHEKKVYDYLKRFDSPVRMEQEYIPQQLVLEELKRMST